MKERLFYHYCSIVHKILLYDKPNYLGQLLTKLKDTHSINTRHKNKLAIIPHNTERFKCSFTYQAAHNYNKLTSNFDVLNKLKLKQFVLNLELNYPFILHTLLGGKSF